MPNEAEFLSPLPENSLLFRRLRAREELGRMPEYRIELLRLTKSSSPIKPVDLLGKSVDLKIEISSSSSRFINGVVTRFERGGTSGRFDIYHVEMRPWLWHLTLGTDCRIFQDKTAVDILDAIFAEYGSSSEVNKRLTGSFRTRPFTVQYRESDFDFVSRLMEEEGIYYYFTHVKGKHTLVLANGPSGHDAMTEGTLKWASEEQDSQVREDVVHEWSLRTSLRSLKFTHTDYTADAPTADLLGTASRTAPYPAPNDLEVFDYPGMYDDLAMDATTSAKITNGGRLAQLKVDEFESGHVIGEALSPYRYLAAGVTWTLTGHTMEADNGDYLITRADFEMVYGGYESGGSTALEFQSRFWSVPKAIKYQPPMVTPRPFVHGPQTATVVGPSGDEIHTDKYGRVKVQFRWDRVGKSNETSSCFVRVSHPWAGKSFGMIALPRIGQEVVVDFLEGNPDRPLITGRVYNGDNMPPYELPAHATITGIKTHSSKGGEVTNANELRFDDLKGSEYIWFQAEKDYHQWVKNDSYESIKNNHWVDVTADSMHSIGGNFTATVGKKLTIGITGDMNTKFGADVHIQTVGAFNLDVKDATAVKLEKAAAVTVGEGLDINVGMNANVTGGQNINLKGGMNIVLEAGMEISLKAGSSFITLGPAGVSISGTMVLVNSGGAASPATEATKADPPDPVPPQNPAENKDPLAS